MKNRYKNGTWKDLVRGGNPTAGTSIWWCLLVNQLWIILIQRSVVDKDLLFADCWHIMVIHPTVDLLGMIVLQHQVLGKLIWPLVGFTNKSDGLMALIASWLKVHKWISANHQSLITRWLSRWILLLIIHQPIVMVNGKPRKLAERMDDMPARHS